MSTNGEYVVVWCPLHQAALKKPNISDKTIKLWKVFEKQLKVVAEGNNEPTNTSYGLQLPKYTSQDTIVAAVPRKSYANGLYIP